MIKKWIYKLRYILIIFSALLGILGLSSSFGLDLSCVNNFCTGEVNLYYSRWSRLIGFSQEGNFSTDDIYNGLQLFANNGRGIVFWNNGDINFINQVKLLPNLGWCYNTNPWINPADCGNYSSSIDSMIELNDGIVFNGFGYYLPFSAGLWYSDANLYFCFYNTHSYCVKSPKPEDYSVSATLREVCTAEYWDGCDIDVFADYLNSFSPFFSNSNDTPFLGGNFGSLNEIEITNGMVVKNYERMGWNKNICYAGTWSGNQLISAPGTGLDIFSIYSGNNPLGFDNIYSWYDYYRDGIWENRNISSGSVFWYNGAFHMNHYNLFANMLKYGVGQLFPSADIIEYCDLILNYDPNASYTGTLTNSEKTIIYNNYYTNTYYTNDFQLSDSGAISTLTGWDNNFTGGNFDFFKDLTIRFQNGLGQLNGNLVGIIPNYILVFLFALIFIRILRK